MTTHAGGDEHSRRSRTPGNATGDAQEPLFPPGPPVGESEGGGYSSDEFDDAFDPES